MRFLPPDDSFPSDAPTGEVTHKVFRIGRIRPRKQTLFALAAAADKEPRYDELAAKVADRNEGAITKLLYPAEK